MATYRDLLGSTFENKFTMNKFQEFIVQFFNNSKIIKKFRKIKIIYLKGLFKNVCKLSK